MAIRDQVAAFLSQLNPAMQAYGADIASKGAGILQKGANTLATTGVAASLQNPLIGKTVPGLVNASNLLYSGGQSLGGLNPNQQTALGYGAVGAGALGLGAAGATVARGNRKRKERLAGQDLGAQLGVQMPGLLLIN
jgi:hypothetical protein